MKKFNVSLQASCTVRFNRLVEADTEEAAKNQMMVLMRAINAGATNQTGEFSREPFGDASYEVTEAPQVGHDFEVDDIEVEEE